MTLADKLTLARIGLAPLAVAAYLLLPPVWCFWVCGWICALAEFTDYFDGWVARRRNEVSDFGKLADPFCDVVYRISIFLVLLLPAGGVGYPIEAIDFGGVQQLVFARLDEHGQVVAVAGLAPWLPVFLMALREVLAGALRAMTATKGLVLAARTSGKAKAWLQGVAIITIMAYPAFWFEMKEWHLVYAAWATWICAVVSVGSFVEYVWVNRAVLVQLMERRP